MSTSDTDKAPADVFDRALEAAHCTATDIPPKPLKQPRRIARGGRYAVVPEKALLRLTTILPDLQSSILLALGWEALRQSRMRQGELAGQLSARISLSDLVRLTGKRKDCVRRAIQKLKRQKIVQSTQQGQRTTVYRISVLNDISLSIE